MATIQELLFLQHGWADTNQVMLSLGQRLANGNEQIYLCAPNLGWWRTWLAFSPLLAQVEEQAIALLAKYPSAPVKIVGHSLGGLIWVELLERHPEWWSRVQSLVLLAAPVGGADLAKIFDPLGWLPLIARDLGKDRRVMAMAIAKHIPTLAIAGDWDQGSDGTVVHGATQFLFANWHCIDRVYHAQVRSHPTTIALIRDFWQQPTIPEIVENYQTRLLRYLYQFAFTPAHGRDRKFAQPIRCLPESLTLWYWQNPVGVRHLFVTDQEGKLIFSGYGGWQDAQKIDRVLAHLDQV